MIDLLFFALALGLGVLLLIAAFKAKRSSSFLSSIYLLAASLVASLGFAVGVVAYLEKSAALASFPPAPEILSQRFSNPHVLLKDSILYVAPPGEKYRTFGHQFTTNRYGFREREFSPEKPDSVFRILVLGDSLTFGVGVDSDHRYTNLLEEMLNLKLKPKKYEVLNFGMGGYATDQERDLLTSLLKKIQCDLVIVGFFWNDVTMTTQDTLETLVLKGSADIPLEDVEEAMDIKDIADGWIFRNSERNLRSIPKDEPEGLSIRRPWYKDSALYRFIEIRTNVNVNGALPNLRLWQYERNEFLEMLKQTKKYGLPAPVVALLYNGYVEPRKNDFRNPKGQLAQNIQLARFVGDQLVGDGFPVVDTLPLFQKYSGMSMAISEWEGHPNYLAHYIYAQSLFDFLMSNGMVHVGKTVEDKK